MATQITREQYIEKFGQDPLETSPTPEPQEEGDSKFSLGQTIKNIPRSGARAVGDIFQAVRHPIQTLKGISDVGEGAIRSGIEKIAGKDLFEDGRQEESFDTMVDFFRERYGGGNFKKTLQEDPVGTALDLSALLSGGGAALRGGTRAATRGSLAAVPRAELNTLGRGLQTAEKVGDVAVKTGQAIEPITALSKGAFIATKPIRATVGPLLRETLGVTTGTGGGTIQQAFRNPTPEFRQALRGKVSTDNVLTAAREGLDTIRQQRASQYKSQLNKIKEAKTPLDISKWKSSITDKLREYNLIDEQGRFSPEGSVIADKTEARRISEFLEEIRKWDDSTPAGLDTLKQRLDDFYSPSSRGREITTSITSELRDILKREVPGYEKMVKEYAEATALIKEIEGTLSLKSGARPDTTLRKLTSAMKDNNEIRRALMDELNALTPNTDMRSLIVGRALNPGVPSGLIGRGIFAGLVGGGVLVNPALWYGILGSSPRVVGEFLNAAGLATKQAERAAKWLTSPEGKAAITSAFEGQRTIEPEEDQPETTEAPVKLTREQYIERFGVDPFEGATPEVNSVQQMFNNGN